MEFLKLENLCEIKTGKKDVNQGNPEGKYPFFTCALEHTYSDTFSYDTEALMIAGNGAVGNVTYYSGKFEAYQRTYILSDFNKKINVKYLNHFLQGMLKDILKKKVLGSTMPYIKVSFLKNIAIPVPPLLEQEKIVERLDKVLNTASTINSINEKKKDLFELLNKSFYEGLFEDMKRFPSAELIEVCNLITDGSHFSPKKFSDEYPYITVKDIDNYGNIDFVNCKKIDKELYLKMKSNNCNPVFGDILFSKDGTIGKTSLIDNENEFVVLSSLAIIRPNQTKINKNFLFNLVSSPKFIELCVAKKTGVAIQRIILKKLKTVNLPLPPLEIQEELNIKIEKFKKYLQTLENNLNSTQIKKDEFKKSFLQKAFSYE